MEWKQALDSNTYVIIKDPKAVSAFYVRSARDSFIKLHRRFGKSTVANLCHFHNAYRRSSQHAYSANI